MVGEIVRPCPSTIFTETSVLVSFKRKRTLNPSTPLRKHNACLNLTDQDHDNFFTSRLVPNRAVIPWIWVYYRRSSTARTLSTVI